MIADYRVNYGDKLQFKAWFDDRAKAEQFAANHHGVITPLVPVKEPHESAATSGP